MEQAVEKVVDYTIIQYGALGILIVILVGVVWMMFKYMDKQSDTHRAERKEWRDESTLAINNSTEVMNDIKTIVTVLNERSKGG